ncbi:hypothetical protein, partial [uncultured Roseobacter sp.]|uniref:hypothetical protein n=1 Tax=uncultured Roseobacter sp. TaxID=114847 RepID=UPI0026104868
KPPALSSLSDLSPLQLTLTAATNLRQSVNSPQLHQCPHLSLSFRNLTKLTIWQMPRRTYLI